MDQARFTATRDALHHAIQVISAWGVTHLEPDADHAYANLGWDPRLEALISRRAHGVAAGLRILSNTWFLTRGHEILAERGVAGSTLTDATAWLREAGVAAGAPDAPVQLPNYELPAHPVRSGEPFPEVAADMLADVARTFGAATTVLMELAAREPTASEVRVWPHHFDIATLLRIDPSAGHPESERTIGVGATPGDPSIPHPYFYVTPWPYPSAQEAAPPLTVGRWHRGAWFGAVWDDLDWDGEEGPLRTFVREAVAASRGLLQA